MNRARQAEITQEILEVVGRRRSAQLTGGSLNRIVRQCVAVFSGDVAHASDPHSWHRSRPDPDGARSYREALRRRDIDEARR